MRTDKMLLAKSGMKVKVFRLESHIGLDDKVLLIAEHQISEDAMEFRDRTFFYLLETRQALRNGLQRAENTGPRSFRSFRRAG